MMLSSVEDDGTTIDYSFEPETWYDALNHFVKFLRANGYGLSDASVLIDVSEGHYIGDNEILNLSNIGFIDTVNKELI